MTMILSSVVFVAQASEPVTVIDTWDDLETGEITESTLRTVTNVFKKSSGSNALWYQGATVTIAEDGYKGKCLTVVNNAVASTDKGLQIQTDDYDSSVNDVDLYFKFRINDNKNTSFLRFLVGSTEIALVHSDGRFWNRDNDGSYHRTLYYTTGVWYDVHIKMAGTLVTTTMSDKDGNSVVSQRTISGATKALIIRENTVVDGASYSIDEVTAIYGGQKGNISFVSANYGFAYNAPTTTVEMYEGFNDSTIANLNYYIRNSKYNSVDNFVDNGFWTSYTGLSMESDCKGGYAPELTVISGKRPWFNTKTVEYGNNKAFASMRFKVVNDNNDTAPIADLGFGTADSSSNKGGAELKIQNGTFETFNYFGNKTYKYIDDIWYTIVFEFEKVENQDQVTLHIYNNQGEEVLHCDPVLDQALSFGCTLTGVAKFAFKVKALENGTHTIGTYSFDDISIVTTNAEFSEDFIVEEIMGLNSTNTPGAVYTTTPVVKANFDQVVAEGSTAKFTAEGKEDVETVITGTGTPLVEIIPVKPLDYGTSYVLDLSNIKGLNQQAFSTASAGTYMMNVAPYSVGTMEVGTPAFADGKMTVNVTFTNAEVGQLNTNLIAALYDANNKLVWAQKKNVAEAKMGQNVFTFSNLPENASELELRVFAWDNFTTLKPLYN